MLYLRISFNNKRVDFSFNRRIQVNSWNSAKEKVKSSDSDFAQTNRAIITAKTKINSIYEKLKYEERLISSEIIKNNLLGVVDEGKTLLDLIEYHNTSPKEKLSPGVSTIKPNAKAMRFGPVLTPRQTYCVLAIFR